MFDRQLAKWHLEKQGYLAAVDVQLGEEGTVDVVGVKMKHGSASHAVFGVVRGWWHTGAYLTPSIIRNHLQTNRNLLDRAFSTEQLQTAVAQFGLPDKPEKFLFYSKRSPSLAEAAERELKQADIRVVYLEDILAEALAAVQAEDIRAGSIFQVLSMVKSSQLFKQMVRLAKRAEKTTPKKTKGAKKEPRIDQRQLDLLITRLEEDETEDDAP